MNNFNFESITSFKKGILKVESVCRTNKKGFNQDRDFLVIKILAKKGSWAGLGGHQKRRESIAAQIMNKVLMSFPFERIVIDFFGVVYEKSENALDWVKLNGVKK